ncbi:MAG: rhomboid family intramembrane serine protease [Dehalococcoidales bacterium]|nr:rhomboid family intramembrane serine protease [Dehalococcoidales bacterium]
MLPLGDHNPRHIIPWFTYLFILINFIVFAFELINGEAFIVAWSFVPERFLANPIGELPTLFTSMFMHAGWIHILGNMLYLWIFGDNIEDRLGHARFIAFYLACGLFATFAHLLFNLNSDIPSLGASGAIAGVLGAYLVMFPNARIRVLFGLFIIRLPAVIVIGTWIFLQLFYGLDTLSNAIDADVAYMAHIGGFLAGFVAAIIFKASAKRKNQSFYIN